MIIPAPNRSFTETCLEWARQGVPVVLKSPCTNLPLYGYVNQPAKSPTEIAALIARHKSRGAGVRIPADWCVLDFDADSDAQYRAFRERYYLLDGAIARTPSGGLHVWFRLEGDAVIINGTDVGEPVGVSKMDILTAKNLVSMPGSWRPAEKRRNKCEGFYRWLKVPKIVPFLTARVVELLKPKEHKHVEAETIAFSGQNTRYGEVCLRNAIDTVAGCMPGNRNATLNCEAYNLGRVAGAGEIEARAAKNALFAAAKASGLVAEDGQARVVKTIESGFTAGMARPLQKESRSAG